MGNDTASSGVSARARRLSGRVCMREIEGGRAQMRSTAALLIARRLRFPWPMLYAFIVVPRPIRDWIYDFIASHRFGFSGRRRP